jgi:hypothetical protein
LPSIFRAYDGKYAVIRTAGDLFFAYKRQKKSQGVCPGISFGGYLSLCS